MGDKEQYFQGGQDMESKLLPIIEAKDAEIKSLRQAFDDRCRVIELQLDDKKQLQAEIERLRHYNESVAVCEKHTPDVIKGDCLVCEIERYKGLCDKWEAEYAEQKAEIKRLTESLEIEQNAYDLLAKDHAKLQAVVDAANKYPVRGSELREALAALKEADDD